MTVKAKRFRIGVEGATTDGREIQREWLEQMAASYNPAVYTALINLEHIKSYLPDSTFNRYGKVTALFAEEITEGPLAGKMALYADVEPTESLVELVKKGQKLFTSMEVSPKFADTGKAYLVGLAATDDPASLGTEMLTFSASAAHNPLANRKQNPANLFTAAEETVIELEEIQDDKPSLFARVTALFTKKEQSDDARFSDVHKAVELVATEQQNLSARTEKSLSEQEERLSELETALQAQQAAFNELVDKLSHEDCRQDYRQRATGGIWTDGIGNTSGVIPGKTITERQAAEGLISNVLRVERVLERCVKQQPPQKVYDAVVSFAFNVGTGNACSSTLVKLLNQRRWADACRQLPRWVYVKGVFNQGLDNRRAREMAWCLQGAN